MRKTLRIFISSPGDVAAERRCAALVIERLRQHYARHFDLESLRWESEPMLASGHFQDAIEPPSAADVVVLILWSRIGVPLPQRTGLREYRGMDGRVPVTGTEWEYEEALIASRARGAPDMLAYRKTAPISLRLDDAERKAKAEAQWAGLDAFLTRHFQDRGQFINALTSFALLEEFAERLEADLRKLLDRRVAGLRGTDAPPAWSGKPFRGLLSYTRDQAPVFFGREAAIRRGVERLAHAAEAGCAFLLLLGASGAGKSSLALAGIVPRLALPGVSEGIGLWRCAVMRPGGTGGDLFAALARALLAPAALGMEIKAGDFGDEEALATQLAAGVGSLSVRPVASALRRGASLAREEGTLLAHQSARLILVVDQLEELFTDPAITLASRTAFLAALEALARSGQVWVLATLRSDFWHRAQEAPSLVALAEEGRRLDVLPPDPSEITEMISGPARLAGLEFERDASRGVALDAVLTAEAAREPGALPLLSFMLDELYRMDVEEGAGTILTFRSHNALGGLAGAIGRRASAVVEALSRTDAEAAAALPAALRRLVTVRAGGLEATALAAPEAAFPAGSPRRRLLNALAAARLVVAEGDEGAAQLRLAHEALLRSWPEAAVQIGRDRRDLETRDRLATLEAAWAAAGRREDALLNGLALEEGRDLLARWGAEELPPSLVGFIATSDTRARRRRRVRQVAMAGVAALALGASAASAGLVWALAETSLAQGRAEAAAVRAEAGYAAARETARTLVFDLARGMRERQGMPADVVQDLLARAGTALDGLLSRAPDDAETMSLRAAAYQQFADSYEQLGDTRRQLAAAEAAVALGRRLVARDPARMEWQRDLSVSLNRLGDAQRLVGANSTAAHREALGISQRLVAQDPANALWQRDLGIALDRASDTGQDASARRASLEAALRIARNLVARDPNNTPAQSDVGSRLGSLAQLDWEAGDWRGALAGFAEAAAVWEALSVIEPRNSMWLRNIGSVQRSRGEILLRQGDHQAAQVEVRRGLAAAQRMAETDPRNALFQDQLAESYVLLSTALARAGDAGAALSAQREAMALIRRLAEEDAGNLPRQQALVYAHADLAARLLYAGLEVEELVERRAALAAARRLLSLNPSDAELTLIAVAVQGDLGAALLRSGAAAEGIGALRDALRTAQATSERAPRNAEAQRAVQLHWDALAFGLRRTGDASGALRAFRESLVIARAMAVAAPMDASRQSDLSMSHRNLADQLHNNRDIAAALVERQAAADVARRLVAADPANGLWLTQFSERLRELGSGLAATGDAAGALVLWRETLEVTRRLAARDATNPRWEGELLRAHLNLSEMLEHFGQQAEALTEAEAAVAVAKRRLQRFPEPSGPRGTAMAELEEALALERQLRAATAR